MRTANVPNYTNYFVCDCCVAEVLCINGILICYVNFNVCSQLTILSLKIKTLFNINRNRKCWRNSFKHTILTGSLKMQSHNSVIILWYQHSHSLIYVRDTLGIRRVRSTNADIHVHVRRCTFCYTQRQTWFFKIDQRMLAYDIYITHTCTLTIR